jgi:glycosyltransferase involved in cell wall biosynthesis
MKIEKIAIVCEDISSPLDEGFKKATSEIAAAIAVKLRATVFASRYGKLPFEVETLPSNKLLLGSGFSSRLKRIDCDAILYIPQTSATPMSMTRAKLIRMQSGGKPVVVLSLQRRTFSEVVRSFISFIRPRLALVLSTESLTVMERAGIRARRVPLGVDTSVFRPPDKGEKERLREKYGLGGDRIALHIGHISARRNLKLLKRLPLAGTRLAVVTSTSTLPDPGVREWLRRESVTVIDEYIEHIEEVYRLADCYVFPTLNVKGAIEIPLSVLEAMATNLPVVTTAFGGIPDLFAEGQGLFIAGDEGEFAEKFSGAMALEGAATRSLVDRLTWDGVAGSILKAIEQGIR